MSTIDGLQHQVTQIAEQVSAPAGPLNLQDSMDFTPFTDAEQRTLRAFLASLQHYADGCTIIPQFLAKITNDELDELERWVHLAETRAAEKAR